MRHGRGDMRRIAVAVSSFGFGMTGCSPDVVLTSADGEVRLEYDCGTRERQVYASYEEAVLKDYARRILEDADAASDSETVTTMLLVQEHGTIGLLEEKVVDHICSNGMPSQGIENRNIFPQVGSLARDFTLRTIALKEPYLGPSVTLSEHRGQVVVLETFGTWCAPCVTGYPEFSEFAKEYVEKGVAVYGVLLRDSPARLAEWLTSNGGMAYPFLEGTEEMTSDWALIGAPSGAVIDGDGLVAHRCFGCSAESLRPVLDSLLNEDPGTGD